MKQHILIVEDDRDMLVLLQQILLQAGYEVSSSSDGRCIVEKTFLLPDLILLDHSMPFIEGVALCKFLRIKPVTKNLPVVIISGHHGIGTRANIAGATSFLPKPFSARTLLRHIHEALNEIHRPELQRV